MNIPEKLIEAAELLAATRLSDDEMLALAQAHGLKSSGRDKFEDSVYDKLVSLKYMKSNKSITKYGRTYIFNEGRDHFNKVIKGNSFPINEIGDSSYEFYKKKGLIAAAETTEMIFDLKMYSLSKNTKYGSNEEMDNQKIASELVDMAESLTAAELRTADAGDAVAYFNTSEFFEGADGERMLSRDQEAFALNLLEDVAVSLSRTFSEQVGKQLRKHEKRIHAQGMALT